MQSINRETGMYKLVDKTTGDSYNLEWVIAENMGLVFWTKDGKALGTQPDESLYEIYKLDGEEGLNEH